jgi:TonB family protein
LVRISSYWPIRGVLVLSLVAFHVSLFYGVALDHSHTSGSDAPPMFGPVVSEVERDRRQHHVTSKEWTPQQPSDSTTPPSQWHFAPIDIWPTDHSPTQSTEFTPVSEAEPDITMTAAKKRSKLRLIVWARPAYTTEEAQAGLEGVVSLSIHVGAGGQPIEERLTASSGYQQLDSSTLRAARLWRFAPPRWQGAPISVWVRFDVHYHN